MIDGGEKRNRQLAFELQNMFVKRTVITVTVVIFSRIVGLSGKLIFVSLLEFICELDALKC